MDNLAYASLQGRILFALAMPPASNILENLPHPWPETQHLPPMIPPQPPIEPLGKNPLRTFANELDEARRVPCQETAGGDWLLDRVRGRWRPRPALQPADFERVFRLRDKALTFEAVLAMLRARTWATPTAFARCFGRGHSFSNSLKWCLGREKRMSQEEWAACFGKMKPPPTT